MNLNGHFMSNNILDGEKHFHNYTSCAKVGFYKRVPLTSIKQFSLMSSQLTSVMYKLIFEGESTTVNVFEVMRLRNGQLMLLPKPKLPTPKEKMMHKKATYISSPLPIMQNDGRVYMEAQCKNVGKAIRTTKYILT